MGSIIVFISMMCVGVVTWAFRLEGKVNVLDQKHIDLKELINTRFDATDKALDCRLSRIEKALNGKE